MLISKIVVSPDEVLLQSDIDGESAYCSQTNTYIDPLTGPHTKSCFRSRTEGKFDSVSYRPGLVWLSKDISPPVDYTSQEVRVQGFNKPAKRELSYEGSQNQVLMFNERIYEQSLATPSKVKPLIANVASVPMKVTLDGMEINIIRYDDKSLTFELVTPWQ